VKKVSLTVLYCGQGMANWIELFTNASDTAPAATILIDFGRDNWSKDSSSKTKAVNYVMTRLKSMSTPTINYTIISHQDGDHWTLLRPLTARLTSEIPAIVLGPVWYGGENWGYTAAQVVKDYAAASSGTPPTPKKFNANGTNYGKPPTVTDFATIGNVALRVLMSNITAIGTTADDIVKNATSAVMVVSFAGVSFLLPGDATVETLSAINLVLDAYKTTVNPSPLGTCRAMCLPHHGSQRTLIQSSKSDPYEVGKTFAGLIKAQAVPASAGYKNVHHHPNIGVFDVFFPYLLTNWINHTIVYWLPLITDWFSATGTGGQFTTIEDLSSPPTSRDWVFSITTTTASDGTEIVSTEAYPINFEPIVPESQPILDHFAGGAVWR